MMMGMAALKGTWPVAASACRMPTEAELDWMMPVSTAPASRPSSGLRNIRNSSRKAGTSARPETAPVIASIPNIKTAKPKRMVPLSFFLEDLLNSSSTTPISAITGVKEVGFSS